MGVFAPEGAVFVAGRPGGAGGKELGGISAEGSLGGGVICEHGC